MKETEKIGLVREALERAEIIAKFKSVQGGIHVFTSDSEDYKKAIRSIENCEVRAHWFMLPEDKPLKTVVKGIPVGGEEEQVIEELVGLGFKVDFVVRMKKDKASPYDIVAVTSERSDPGKKLFDVRKLGGFRVRVESKRKPQRFRYQGYGLLRPQLVATSTN